MKTFQLSFFFIFFVSYGVDRKIVFPFQSNAYEKPFWWTQHAFSPVHKVLNVMELIMVLIMSPIDWYRLILKTQ